MMTLEINHCELRGTQLEPVKVIKVNSESEAREYISSIPVRQGYEYYYGFLKHGEDKVLIDPTFNHRFNLQQRFLKVILGTDKQK